jgi:hypothetical protein
MELVSLVRLPFILEALVPILHYTQLQLPGSTCETNSRGVL